MYPSDLTSLTAIRKALKNQATKSLISSKKTASDVVETPLKKVNDAVKTNPEKESPLPKKQDVQPKVEGII